MKQYHVTEGEWIQPIMKGYKMECCDCGLVHTINFRIVVKGRSKKVQLQAFRNNRATGQTRRKYKIPLYKTTN